MGLFLLWTGGGAPGICPRDEARARAQACEREFAEALSDTARTLDETGHRDSVLIPGP